MKTEMVVRGYMRKADNSAYKWTVWPTTYDHCTEDQPVTLLLHGKNGEVGGLSQEDVDLLVSAHNGYDSGDFLGKWGQEPAKKLRILIAKIERILNPEVNDET